ncbi:kinase-like domain-containing protein [Xylariaceae sp. FL0662B]|nr:kinase-like domain-containing protein [Xylariaceae sp. FL0662B]
MNPELLAIGSTPSLRLRDEISPVATPSYTSLSMPERGEPPRKLRDQGSRVMSALRSLTNSNSSSSIREPTTWPVPSPTPGERSPEPRRLLKRMAMPFHRGPFGASVTVIHRIKSKSRPSVRSMEKAANEPVPAAIPEIVISSMSNGNSNSHSYSNTNSNTTSGGKSSNTTNGTGTTAKTSTDSKASSKDNNSGERKSASPFRRREPEADENPESNLTTIQETALDLTSPTILTVERAAAAKIFLETCFNEKLSKPSPRSLRRRYLEGDLYHADELTEAEKNMRRRIFYQQESDHLRETRVLMAKSIGAVQGKHDQLADNYEVLKILGKGSFGVVRLVREKANPVDQGHDGYRRKKVYAMKVIRKSTMLRTSQEGHLRAERDFLVASEGAKWIVPLIASFQDAANLYLVMDYMPGGDFLGLLIRENILSEPVAKFYVAEMILCVEEAHSLRCVHRDIKPDNFLIDGTGHLKLSDFGLAFDGHWSHDTSYYHTQRYSLLQKLGISVEGDALDRAEGLQGSVKWAQGVAQAMRKHERLHLDIPSPLLDEPLLNWRNRYGNRSAARSCWSVGVILYECLYGHTPFLSEEGGRQQTKRNIVNHKQTFAFPPRPVVSRRCMDLIANLVSEKETRLSSKRYQYRDRNPEPSPSSKSRHRRGYQDWTERSVYPHDAEDIKAHKFFRDIPWDRLHQISPPFVPQLNSSEDTHYFDEEESISDWSESQPETSSETEDIDMGPLIAAGNGANALGPPVVFPRTAPRRSPEKMAAIQAQLAAFPYGMRAMLGQIVAAPYDSTRLKRMDREIETMAHHDARLCGQMKAFVRKYGRRERKRPRDRLLRDRNTKSTVLEVRKQTAFMGYTYSRIRGSGAAGIVGWGAWENGDGNGNGEAGGHSAELASYRAWHCGRGGGG